MAFASDDDLEDMNDSSNKCNEDPNVQKGKGGITDGKPAPLTQTDRVTTSDALTFNLENDSSILGASSKPTPIADGSRMSTGSTVDHIIAADRKSVV